MKNHNRRDFIKQVSATGAVLATGAFVSCAEKASASCSGAGTEENIQSKLIIPKAQGLKISGTFLDEISHDIPHQNWGGKGMGSGFCLYESDRDRYGNRDPERLSQVYHLSFGVSDENIRLLYAFGRSD